MRANDGAGLARRLAALRQDTWPDCRLTQKELGAALRRGRPLSAPTISSWESATNPRLPGAAQLADYARFFATRRSVTEGLIPDEQLTHAELTTRRNLEAELLALRSGAVGTETTADPLGEIWRLDERPVTIVCSDLPEEVRAAIPPASQESPDYAALYSYGELDALIEIFGHIRAANPECEVAFRSASTLQPDDYTTHLVVLGGTERNEVARDVHARLDMPVRQLPEEKAFQPAADDSPVFGARVEDGALVEDVAHLFRTTNPFNVKRTLTMCSAVSSRGVLGAVRALTDARFRNRNESYVLDNFASRWSFSILMRVPIVSGQTVTPDWTVADTILHTWPSRASR